MLRIYRDILDIVYPYIVGNLDLNEKIMNPKDKKFIESWSKTRKVGMTKFMIFSGGLWGVVTAVVMQLFELGEMTFREAYFSQNFAIQLLLFIIIGTLLFGLAMWKINEKRFLKLTKSK